MRTETHARPPIGPRHLWMLAVGIGLVAWMQAGCTRIQVRDSGQAVEPRIAATKLGGQMHLVEHPDGRLEIVTDDVDSFQEGAKTLRRLVSGFVAASVASDYFEAQTAETTAQAAAEQARIAAEVDAAEIAAQSELNLLEEANRAAEALASP